MAKWILALCLMLLPQYETGSRTSGQQSSKQPDNQAAAEAALTPGYTPDGKLQFPSRYREWIYLSTGLDMSYNPTAMVMDRSTFDNVFVDPAAYQAFRNTGHWPDKTIFALEVRGAESNGSINKRGHFQSTQRMAVEVHIKDEKRFSGGWAFFAFDDEKPAEMIPAGASCYSCHQQHGAVDTTFVQFYPTALGIAKEKNTLSESYLKETTAEQEKKSKAR